MFLEKMAMHHAGAIEMARLVPERTAHADELVPFADNITRAQQEEIDTINGWLAAWYGANASEPSMGDPGMEAEMDAMMSDLEAKRGDAFDLAFLGHMIEHHGSAIEMAEAILAKQVHNETRELAQTIIAAQEEETATMRAWQAEWNTTGSTTPPTGTGGPLANRTDESTSEEVPAPALVSTAAVALLVALALRRRR